MSSKIQLKALMKKNLILMKRNWCSFLCELFFPIILMLLLVSVRSLIKVDEKTFDFPDEVYIRNNSAAFVSSEKLTNIKFINNLTLWNEMTFRNPLASCLFIRKKPTNVIGIISNNSTFTNIIADKVNKFTPEGYSLRFKNFTSKEELFNYVKDIRYAQLKDYPELCFGLNLQKLDDFKYNISFHFYDSNIVNKIQEIPTTMTPALDPFKNGPDMESYGKWLASGYLQMQQILNEIILQDITKNPQAELSFGVMSQKFSKVYFDKFGEFIGAISSFFLIIAYLCPLCIFVFRMVQEKESKAKEGMKIMGLSSVTYFLSFFLYWIVLNTFYSVINALILSKVLKYINYLYIFAFLWLFGMTIFSLAYFLQATMNRTRVAMIMTVLLYFTMYFISAAVLQQDIAQSIKMILSILPPTCLGFGLYTMTKFDSNQVNFGGDQINIQYNNFSVANMYVMLAVDTVLYLFLGYYLENVLPQQFGIKKPFYFLCSKNFWCKKQKKLSNKSKIQDHSVSQNHSNLNQSSLSNNKKLNMIGKIMSDSQRKTLTENLIDKNYIKENKDCTSSVFDKSRIADKFQSEENYQNKIEAGECLQIKNLTKVFDDGKRAVDGLSLNIYENEIFALLGHNGAGKSTTISILTGLYEATSGEAIYDSENILNADQMADFRKILGICPQNDVLFNNLTVKEHLEMFSVFKGIESQKIEEEVNKILAELYMENKKDTQAVYLSGGEKRKLSIAIALIGGSKVVFLDEPSSGMDITSRRNLWEILKKCTNDRIIVLTTHYMEEAAVLGNRIGIMSNGQLKCCGNSLFLIDKFGKYISLNIFKKPNAVDNEIINFVKRTLQEKIPSYNSKLNLLDEIEIEILSEEILIRIPKTNDFSFQSFFEEFDKNLSSLNIKTYEASMPSLEDVFLNVSAETHSKIKSNTIAPTDVSNPDKETEDENRAMNVNGLDNLSGNYYRAGFFDQFVALFLKRVINIIRDKKSFLLEIVCPFVLVLVGLLISSIKFFNDSPSSENIISALPLKENIITAKYGLLANDSINDYFLTPLNQSKELETIEIYENLVDLSNLKNNLIDFNNYLFQKFNKTNIKNIISNNEDQSSLNNFGTYLFFSLNNNTKQFQFASFVNTNARFSPIIFTQHMQRKIINFASGKEVIINSFIEPLPLTSEEKNQGQARNISNLVFFVSVAFALIPANFITIIIRERDVNNKHLQILSGVSKFNYWLSNFVFELVKYYIIAGLISIVIYLFDDFVEYFWIFYILYGPSMILFTYFLSFIFNNESSGQNGVILLNFLLGTLAGNVVLIFRVLPDLTDTGKLLAYIFRICPSFALTYGYSQLLLSQLLIQIDKNIDKDIKMIDIEYAGADVIFLAICFFVSLILIFLFESSNICYKSKKSKNSYIIPASDHNKVTIGNSAQNSNDKIIKEKSADKSINYSREDFYSEYSDTEKNNNNKDCETNIIKIAPEKPFENENDKIKNKENLNDIESNIDNADTKEDNKYSIEVKNLIKNYPIGGFLGLCKNDFRAVNNLSFNLRFGECFALLGVTGAGKTSTFKCLTSETTIDGGSIAINGINIGDSDNNLGQISNLIGYCPQKDAIFDYMTVYENLDFYARIKGIKGSEKQNLIESLMQEMNLQSYKNKISGNLSGGNKRKLSVAISLIGNPPIILLDEPSTGMDPEARRFMWAVIYKISRRNKMSSVILTTHSMEEAETLCRRIGIMVDGQFKCLGTNQYLKDKYGDSFEVSYIFKNCDMGLINSILYSIKNSGNINNKRLQYQNVTLNEFINNNDFQNEKILGELIFAEDACHIIDTLDKKEIYKKILKTFIFNEFEFSKDLNITIQDTDKISISLKALCSYIFYIEKILLLTSQVLDYFDNVNIIYIYENNIKLKLPKNTQRNDPTIGFLLGLLENRKSELFISEFSITQTSLEQIFNKFASEKEKVLNSEKQEIIITKNELEN